MPTTTSFVNESPYDVTDTVTGRENSFQWTESNFEDLAGPASMLITKIEVIANAAVASGTALVAYKRPDTEDNWGVAGFADEHAIFPEFGNSTFAANTTLWGQDWSNIDRSNNLEVKLTTASGTDSIYLDSIQVRITYTNPFTGHLSLLSGGISIPANSGLVSL